MSGKGMAFLKQIVYYLDLFFPPLVDFLALNDLLIRRNRISPHDRNPPGLLHLSRIIGSTTHNY
jgi:hypothetical protein